MGIENSGKKSFSKKKESVEKGASGAVRRFRGGGAGEKK